MHRILLLLLVLALAGCATVPMDVDEFPIGIYGVRSEVDIQAVAQAGFNTVTGTADASYLDAAQAAGVRVLARPGSFAGERFDPAAARQIVSQFDRHPALWAWYLIDEPDLNGVPPWQVRAAHEVVKSAGARKPTALVLFKGENALNYAHIADVTMIDRYPIPWLPLANFEQHVRMTRLALGREKPLIAVIQAFDWSYYPDLLPGETNLRPPTYEELRCMTYGALAEQADGIFYYAFNSRRWHIQEHPETWQALVDVVAEVRERMPLFQAEHLWWDKLHGFGDRSRRFNPALSSSVNSVWLRVHDGSEWVPAGDYILAVNTTDDGHVYRFTMPGIEDRPASAGSHQTKMRSIPELLAVFEEDRWLAVRGNWVEDYFEPFAVRVYGPF